MTEFGQYVPGLGPSGGSQLMIVGIAPADEELKQGKPFVGPSGYILREDLKLAGYDINDSYRTNIFKYKLPNNEFAKYKEMGLNLQDALADLQEEINAVNPNCILGLGDPVLYSLTGKSGKFNGINVWRGSILSALGRKAIFTWHPAHELHAQSAENQEGKGQYKSWQRYIRRFDIQRAVNQSKFPEISLPQRLLRVAGSSSDVYRFLEKNENEKYCAIDIEAIENVPVCIGLSFHPSEALSIPLWNTLPINVENRRKPKKSYSYNLKVSTIPTEDLAYIWKLIANLFLNNKYKFIGQNFKYDEDKLNSLGFYLHSLYWDTMIASHCVSSEMPKGLAFNTSVYTEEPYYKLEGKNFVPGKDKIEEFFFYNGKDACLTREIFDFQRLDLLSIKNGIEHITWRMGCHKAYLEVDRIGFRIDENERRILIQKYVNWLVKLEKEFYLLVHEYGVTEVPNIASPVQMAEIIYGNMKIAKRTGRGKGKSEEGGTGEQILTALIGNVVKDAKKIRALEIILEWRRVNKSLGYLQAEPDYDKRMKTTFLISGTENFRTSTNVLEEPIRPVQCGWAFQTVSKHGDIGQDLRSILVPDNGYVIVNIDQSQAEARVCSLLADDEETLLSYDKIDKHALTAAKFFGGTEQTYSKKVLGFECPERFVGKTLRHAYHLDIGKREAMINVNTDARKYKIPIRISEWRAGECLKILEWDTPKIKSVFHHTIQELLFEDRRLFGTYGASRYFYDEIGTRDLYKGAYSFIPQQTVSDKTKQVLLKIIKHLWDVKVVVESHDALAMLIRIKVLEERIEEIVSWFEEPIDFSECSIPRRPLVIPCDVEVGYDYKNLEKYKGKLRAA